MQNLGDDLPNLERSRRRRSITPTTPVVEILDEGFVEDEEWSTPVTKILKLPYDHESWQHAHEILEPPSPLSRKVADEARSIAARHIIDRLKEENLLNRIHKVAPRLRSAVELLSKPDADYVYPKFQFVVNELRRKYPQVYHSVIQNVGSLELPHDMKPSVMLVSLTKSTVENIQGELDMDWGKFAALLGLTGALAIDSVKADYPDGVAEVVETFGLLIEHVLGEWILNEGGGWEGFIQLNVYKATLPPVPRTIVILILITSVAFLLYRLSSALFYAIFVFEETDCFWTKWFSTRPYCSRDLSCIKPRNPLEFLYFTYNGTTDFF